jgi:hypothetical protein
LLLGNSPGTIAKERANPALHILVVTDAVPQNTLVFSLHTHTHTHVYIYNYYLLNVSENSGPY